jgi:transcriptional regulator NrdR family protein
MTLAVDVVKRRGSQSAEAFDTDKLRRSIRATCLSVHVPEGEAELVAHKVTATVIKWLENKPVVTSHDLRRLASLHLQLYHPDAAYYYKHHRLII